MLNIYFGEMPEAIYNTATYFNNKYLDSWITDEFAKKVIKAVDKSEVIGPKLIDSKALGAIPVTGLSGGTKTLLLIKNEPGNIFNASTCGDNCAEWILKIAEESKEDITINLRHIMDFGRKKFEIRILNNGEIVHNMDEYVRYAGLFL